MRRRASPANARTEPQPGVLRRVRARSPQIAGPTGPTGSYTEISRIHPNTADAAAHVEELEVSVRVTLLQLLEDRRLGFP